MSEKQNLSKKQNLIQIIKFALFSASAGIIQLVSFTLLFEVLELSNTAAYIISLSLSVLWNFTFNRKFTFKSAANIPVAMVKVALFYCVFAPLSTWWTHELTALGINEYLIEAVTMLVNLITEYLYCRFVVYRNSMNTAK